MDTVEASERQDKRALVFEFFLIHELTLSKVPGAPVYCSLGRKLKERKPLLCSELSGLRDMKVKSNAPVIMREPSVAS